MTTLKALVVLSGGQDSTTCAFMAKARGYELHAITFDYGQRHSAEVEAAFKVSEMVGIAPENHELLVLPPGVLASTSPLVNKRAELEQYENHASLPGGLEKTFVPMRNQLFLTLAANRAYAKGIEVLFTGVCQEDFGGYPDCRRDFIDALTNACNEGTFTGRDGAPGPLVIRTPLMHMTKAQSVLAAMRIDGCYEALAFSHTSYDGQYPPTGHDHATLLRAKGFEEADVPDPLVLRAVLEGKMPMPKAPNYRRDFVELYMKRVTAAMGEGA